MKRSVIAAALAAGLVLAGCDNGGTEPAAPPTSEEALTTATAPPTPTPSDEVEVTTEAEAAPTTEVPEAEDAPMDFTEEGAVAFVEHYIRTLNSVHLSEADVQELRDLAEPDCLSCQGFANAAEEPFGEEYMGFVSASADLIGKEARVETVISQLSTGSEIDTVFTLIQEGDGWLVSEIQLAASR